jgi:hypothetical protein
VRLSNGVAIVPFSSLPQTPISEYIGRKMLFSPGDFMLDQNTFAGAYLEYENVPMKKTAEEAARVTGLKPTSDLLERTVKAFTLLNDNAKPVIGTSWLEFSDADLNSADFGMIAMMPRDEGASHSVMTQKVDETAIGIVEGYLKLKGGLANVCDLAIDRINLGRRRFQPGNRAIEGCIALEALLLTENQKDELRYRTWLRAALLLGTNLNERREIKKATREFYDLRSKTVHGKRASDATPEDERIAYRGMDVCSRALHAIIQLEYIPQWSDWELSGGNPGSGLVIDDKK